jgi:uncharacterized protein (DUF433 family)
MEIAQHISVDPTVHHGVAVITGTRVPVSIVIGTKQQVEAALAYATELVKQTEVIALGA